MPQNPLPNGPIPGENFTSDTKNYPWHRPPEHIDLDKALEDISGKIFDEDASLALITSIEDGMDVATLTDMMLTSGIGKGKWTPDFALLLAGPTSHMICILCEGAGVPYDLGISYKKPVATGEFIKAKKADEEQLDQTLLDMGLDEISLAAQKQMQPPKVTAPPAPQGGGMMTAPAPKGV